MSLFDENHLAHVGDRPGLQPIQIHAAGDVLATMVAAIPMGGAGTRQILTRCAITHVDFSDHSDRRSSGGHGWGRGVDRGYRCLG